MRLPESLPSDVKELLNGLHPPPQADEVEFCARKVALFATVLPMVDVNVHNAGVISHATAPYEESLIDHGPVDLPPRQGSAAELARVVFTSELSMLPFDGAAARSLAADLATLGWAGLGDALSDLIARLARFAVADPSVFRLGLPNTFEQLFELLFGAREEEAVVGNLAIAELVGRRLDELSRRFAAVFADEAVARSAGFFSEEASGSNPSGRKPAKLDEELAAFQDWILQARANVNDALAWDLAARQGVGTEVGRLEAP